MNNHEDDPNSPLYTLQYRDFFIVPPCLPDEIECCWDRKPGQMKHMIKTNGPQAIAHLEDFHDVSFTDDAKVQCLWNGDWEALRKEIFGDMMVEGDEEDPGKDERHEHGHSLDGCKTKGKGKSTDAREPSVSRPTRHGQDCCAPGNETAVPLGKPLGKDSMKRHIAIHTFGDVDLCLLCGKVPKRGRKRHLETCPFVQKSTVEELKEKMVQLGLIDDGVVLPNIRGVVPVASGSGISGQISNLQSDTPAASDSDTHSTVTDALTNPAATISGDANQALTVVALRLVGVPNGWSSRSDASVSGESATSTSSSVGVQRIQKRGRSLDEEDDGEEEEEECRSKQRRRMVGGQGAAE